nr:PaaI family thioesterase [Acuticoccus mangrovi]
MRAEFPQVFIEEDIVVSAAEGGFARMSLRPGWRHQRPGGIVSGPTLMMLADAAGYAALLSLGANAKMAVTTNLNVSFMRGASAAAPIQQEARVIKPGRRLSVILAEAMDPDGKVLAHTTMTYAMPES